MCSRFEVNLRPRDIAPRFGSSAFPDGYTTGEVRPTDPALTYHSEGFHTMTWGLSVSWDTKPLINARSETLTEKPTFQRLLNNRCTIPASAYFEWRRDGRARYKNRIAAHDGAPFWFAALYDGPRFTILTTQPIPEISDIHNRMPVILTLRQSDAWCDPASSFEDAHKCISSLPDLRLNAVEEKPRIEQPDLFASSP